MIPRAFVILAAGLASGAVVDRVAVVVGKTVFTESEVLQEIQLTAFQDQQPLDFGPAARRAAAERLVDQQLIRNEMKAGQYAQPSPSEADGMLRRFREEHFATTEQYRAALARYGITEEELKQHLLWELAAMRFTDQRFGINRGTDGAVARQSASSHAAQTPRGPEGAPRDSSVPTAPQQQGANREAPDGESNSVDQQMGAWLKEARSQTKIQFKKEAFQ